MKYFIRTATTLLLAGVMVLTGRGNEGAGSEKKKIELLIAHLESLKGAEFVRNGREYDAETAAKFLRGKWQARESDILTAADFIDKVASVSTQSGQPYLIRFSDGREQKCAEYLREVLGRLPGGS